MNNFRGLWGIGAIIGCLIPGSEMVKAEEYCLLECKSQTEEVVQIWGLDWLICI